MMLLFTKKNCEIRAFYPIFIINKTLKSNNIKKLYLVKKNIILLTQDTITKMYYKICFLYIVLNMYLITANLKLYKIDHTICISIYCV